MEGTNEGVGPVATLRASADVSGIVGVDVVRALRDSGWMGLADAKRAVDLMLGAGEAVVARGPYVATFAHDLVHGRAIGTLARLSGAGVSVFVDGRPVDEYLAWALDMTDEEDDRLAVRISPANGLAGVSTIPAIVALRATGSMGLRDAKAAVETMVERGWADLGYGRWASMLADPHMAGFALELEAGLAAAGVALCVGGVPVSDYVARPSPAGPSGG